jgi:hypothetical protein
MGGPSSSTDPTQVVIKAYRQMLSCLFLGATSVIAVLVILIFLPPINNNPTFLVVVLAGTMGAFFSALQRLYDFKELPQILYEKDLVDAYGTLFIYSLVPVLVGGIAAAAIYLVFAGEFLSGSLFPTFSCSLDKCANFNTLISSYAPSQAADYAKAILWGFIAGFAERLVPNLLTGFAQDAENAKARTAKAAADPAKTSSSSATGEPEIPAVTARVDGAGPTIASRGIANQE